MKPIIFLLFLISILIGNSRSSIFVELSDIDISKPLNTSVELPPGKTVTFRLYTRDIMSSNSFDNSSTYETLILGEETLSYLSDKPLKVVTHGWMSDGSGNSCAEVMNAYLSHSDINVIVADWGDLAGNILYIPSAEVARPVGDKIGEMVESLMSTYGFNGSSVHLIGHSLGAHVMGYAGRYLRERNLTVANITGLDPAAPLFEYPTQEGLMSSDANFVQVIHTNGWYLGMFLPRGHVDFYPNGGGPGQPDCNAIETLFESCAHSRSYKLFTESILKGGFTSQKCDGFSDYKNGKCSNTDTEPMGDDCSINASGKFYLETNGEPTYSLF